MLIVIPTRGRRNNQLTMRNLPTELQKRTIIVAPKDEAFWIKQDFSNAKDVVAQPDPGMRIAEKRKWIMETFDVEKLVMLDDDLRFAPGGGPGLGLGQGIVGLAISAGKSR